MFTVVLTDATVGRVSSFLCSCFPTGTVWKDVSGTAVEATRGLVLREVGLQRQAVAVDDFREVVAIPPRVCLPLLRYCCLLGWAGIQRQYC